MVAACDTINNEISRKALEYEIFGYVIFLIDLNLVSRN